MPEPPPICIAADLRFNMLFLIQMLCELLNQIEPTRESIEDLMDTISIIKEALENV